MAKRMPAAERRQQLLETAAKLFAERGYARTTTSELARAAGVTEPIIYRHFKSKKDLFIALIDETGAETIEQWKQELTNTDGPATRLRLLIGANPMVRARGESRYRVIVQAMTEIEDEEILAAIRRHMQALHRFLAEQVAEAQDAGQVSKRFSPDITAWLLMHLGLGYGVLAPVGMPGHGKDESGQSVRDVVEQLMLGVRD
jgi:AcrR family transcriptional regulator